MKFNRIISILVIALTAGSANCNPPSKAINPQVPAGDVQPITPPVPVRTPTPAPPTDDPTPDVGADPLAIVATLDGMPFDNPVVAMEAGQMLVLTLTGSAVTPQDGKELPAASWSLNQPTLRFHSPKEIRGHEVSFTEQTGVWLFQVAVNNPDAMGAPFMAQRWVTVGELPPPIPPPGPGPKPPPGPTPEPSPIPIAGLHALIIEETDDRENLTSAQRDVMLATVSGSFRDYVKSHGPKDNFFLLDQNDDVSMLPQWAQDAFKRPRTSTPWIIFGNETGGFEGEMPKTTDDTLKIAKPIGGQ